MEFITEFWFESIIKLILGFLLAGIIGLEREVLNKPAGFKTHSLIGISAVLVMLCGEYLAMNSNIDASRIPAQLLSGIGFIGAGTILTDGFNVKGLTTATSLLAVTCIGLCIGAGFYVGGISATIIVYLILSYSHKLAKKLDYSNNIELQVKIKKDEEVMNKLELILQKYNISIQKITVNEEDDRYNELKIIAKTGIEIPENKLQAELVVVEGIAEVSERKNR